MLLKTFTFVLSIFLLSGAKAAKDPEIISSLETFTIKTGQRKVIYSNKQHFEAPNWSRDGKQFAFVSYKLIK